MSDQARGGLPRRSDIWRLARLTQKELRETLRDRRTMITLLLMPLLVYPILSLIFRTFLVSGAVSLPVDQPVVYHFALQSDVSNDAFLTEIASIQRDALLVETQRAALIEPYLDRESPGIARFGDMKTSLREAGKSPDYVHDAVNDGEVDAGAILYLRDALAQSGQGRRQPIRVEIIANTGLSASRDAGAFLRDYFEAINRLRMQRYGVLHQSALLIDPNFIFTPPKTRSAISFGTLIPFILVLMTITGAVYPAIDLTAGERERGTLEALVAAPIPRMRILFSKFVAVLTVAMLTATLNLIGMLGTVWAFRLEALVFQSGEFSLGAILQVFALLLLFAAFFSAVLLAVTSFARSFKEAQAYLIPLILLSLAPGVVSLAPGMNLSGPVCLVPLLNFVLLARDILQGQAATAPAILAVLSTLLYAALAIGIAARIFGTDAILYGSHESVKDSLRRPAQPREVASPLMAMLCLTCLFPANFLAISILSRMADSDIQMPLIVVGISTVLFFVGIPLLFAWHQRIRISTGFAVRLPRPVPFLAACIVGLSVWPISLVIIAATQGLITLISGAEASSEWQQRLVAGGMEYVERWRQLPLGIIVLTHALIPAVAEEWFFRGFFLQALLARSKSAAWPIVFSGVVFGAFHLLTESVIALDRLVPTTLMGILLGYVCYRTGSIIPGICLHLLNNATVVSLAYLHRELQDVSWFPFRGDELPIGWVVGLLGVAFAALLALTATTRTRPPPAPADGD